MHDPCYSLPTMSDHLTDSQTTSRSKGPSFRAFRLYSIGRATSCCIGQMPLKRSSSL
jgi:hypothetical protein